MVRLCCFKFNHYICTLKLYKFANLKSFIMKKSLLQAILMGGVLLVALASCKKEEKPGQLESIKFKDASYTIAENDQSLNLRKELETVPAGVLDTAKIIWTISDESVAAMGGNFLEPKRSGDIVVVATIQGKNTSCNVKITEVPIESFELEDFAVQINGTAKALLTTVPSGISHERFTWSVGDNTIATIDQSGVVTGLKEGNTTVTATVGSKSKTCKLAAKKVVVDNVTVTPESARMYKIGETLLLHATLTPPDASFPTVTWKSSDPYNVSVDENGIVTVKKYWENPVMITATADGKKGTCFITAYPQQATKIVLSETSHTFSKIGDSFTLYITKIEPAQRTLTDEFDWTPGSFVAESGCDQGVCLVDGTVSGPSRTTKQSVTVTCTGVGTDKIHCTDYWSHVDAYCTVTMPVKPITSITLSKTSEEVTIAKGSFTINATVNSDANEKLKWTVSTHDFEGNASVTPSADGLSVTVTPTRAGKCTIKASSPTTSTSAQCELYIVEDIGSVQDVKGYTYKTVKIGSQWWMAQNMRCRDYDTQSGRSGDYIGGSYDVILAPYYFNCYSLSDYNDWSVADKDKIGFAYNWAAAVGLTESQAAAETSPYSGRRQGICPNGWHIPTEAEFRTLLNYDENSYKLHSRKYWTSFGGGYDRYGFCGMPVGYYWLDSNGNGTMYDVGEYSSFWTADALNADKASSLNLQKSGAAFYGTSLDVSKKSCARSVRCVKNN